LREETNKNSFIISAKDIGIQSDRRFYEDAFLLNNSPEDLRLILEKNPSTYLITRNKWDYSESVFPDQFEIFPEFFTPITKQPADDFVIWVRK